ncbi:MAG: RluA family pseudouridine synthase, partial [Opitutales bacterium]|nr:RluA family pseudouridine synthase [Opitutales bacterium]
THAKLAKLFHDREVKKQYFAIVQGNPVRDRDVVDEPIGTHPRVREQMAIRRGPGEGKPALTLYEVVERFRGFAVVQCKPKSGRTHQIRIHLSEAGHPIVGEKVYIRNFIGPLIPGYRVMLHAAELGFIHPKSDEAVSWTQPLPKDFKQRLKSLQLRSKASPKQVKPAQQ